jgi:hypothetical protein
VNLGGQTFENASEYVRSLQAAIDKEAALAEGEALEVDIDLDGDLPLVQRTLLR